MTVTQNPYQSFIDMEDSKNLEMRITKAYCNKGNLFKQMYLEFDENFRSDKARNDFQNFLADLGGNAGTRTSMDLFAWVAEALSGPLSN